jgi:nicotinamide-nucleotide amidase
MLLPGPPRELKPMFEEACLPRLRALLPPLALATRWYRIAGMGESDCDALIAPVYREYANPVTTILAKPGDIEVHLRARSGTMPEAEALAADLGGKIEELLGDRIFSRDGSALEAVTGQLLAARGETVAVAESMTGGMLGMRLTDTPGSSAWFRGGYLVYARDLKERLIGGPLPGDPVSEATAVALAAAARDQAAATWGLSITGFAGPEGDAGLAYIGVAGPGGAAAREFRLLRERSLVRTFAATYALDLLRKRLLPDRR